MLAYGLGQSLFLWYSSANSAFVSRPKCFTSWSQSWYSGDSFSSIAWHTCFVAHEARRTQGGESGSPQSEAHPVVANAAAATKPTFRSLVVMVESFLFESFTGRCRWRRRDCERS